MSPYEAADYMIPPGKYKVSCVEAVHFESSHKKTPGLEVTWCIIEGPYKGKKVKDQIWFTKKAVERLEHFQDALGVASIIDMNAQDLVGAICMINTTLEPGFKNKHLMYPTVIYRGYEPAEYEPEFPAGDEDSVFSTRSSEPEPDPGYIADPEEEKEKE